MAVLENGLQIFLLFVLFQEKFVVVFPKEKSMQECADGERYHLFKILIYWLREKERERDRDKKKS
jgi:hypothetical protein